jgi:hypothetical protein
MGLFRRRPSLERLRQERSRIVQELDVCREQAAWNRASDDPFELREARAWQAQANALQHALDELDQTLLRAELDELG